MGLSKIPGRYFEAVGVIIGLLGSLTIGAQIYAECTNDNPSTLSPIYVLGWLFIFLFWTIYGVKFNRLAMWLTNGIAVCIQALLFVIIMLK